MVLLKVRALQLQHRPDAPAGDLLTHGSHSCGRSLGIAKLVGDEVFGMVLQKFERLWIGHGRDLDELGDSVAHMGCRQRLQEVEL